MTTKKILRVYSYWYNKTHDRHTALTMTAAECSVSHQRVWDALEQSAKWARSLGQWQ